MKADRNTFTKYLLPLLIIGIGLVVRVIKFPEIPPGFNQDEAGSAYDAYSLAETGKDRWGNHLPVYFPSWGSGQNVLMAYLSVPVINILGLNIFSARFVSLLLGILTLPLFYYCTRSLNEFSRLFGLFLISVVPWHFMLSRWALESNLAPFFMLAGCTMLFKAFRTGRKRWILPSLIPFDLALYAYGTTILVLPIFFGLIFRIQFKNIRRALSSWIVAFSLFLVVAFPFILFFLENYILKQNLSWTDNLFFSTPLFPGTRFSEEPPNWLITLRYNLSFFYAGFDDLTTFNLLPGFSILYHFILPIGLAGFAYGGYKFFNKKYNHQDSSANLLSVFFAWGIASFILFFILALNVNRFNHFYIPCIVMASWIISLVLEYIKNIRWRKIVMIAVITFYCTESAVVIHQYFTSYPKGDIRLNFSYGLKEAFESIRNLNMDQIKVTDQMSLPYVETLFFLQYPPEKFHKEVQFEIWGNMYMVNRFGKFIFNSRYLDLNKPFGFISRRGETIETGKMKKTVLFASEMWETGIVK